MKRSEYLDNYDGGEAGAKLHRAYYEQFVTDEVRNVVLRCIGADAIKASTDPHFNDIRLDKWDRMVTCRMMPIGVAAALKEAGDWFGLGSGVCILKEAAQQIRDGARFEVRSAGKLEGAFYTKSAADGYAAELRGNGAANVTVEPE